MSDTSRSVEGRILEAAHALVAEGQPLTMQRLAERVGLSRSTLYRKVGNKARLLALLAWAEGRDAPPPETRERILLAARRVLARRGFVAATVEEIAEEAGVGVATVYRLFGSKEGLLRAFAEEVLPRAAIRKTALAPSEDLRQDLEALMRVMLAFFAEHRDLARLVFLGHEDERAYLERLRQETGTLFGDLTAYFRHQVQAGRLRDVAPPHELALAFVGLALAFSVVGPLHYGLPTPDIHKAARRLVTLFLEGVT